MRKICFVIFCCWLAVPVILNADKSDEILKKIDTFRVPYKNFLVRTKITSFEHDQVTEVGLFDAFINGEDKSLVIAKKYRTRGMKILYVKANMWVQLPNTHRPIRITPIQRLMGEASNGDVARVGLSRDYTAEDLGTEMVEGIACLKLRLTARTRSATYHEIMLYVREKDFRTVKAEFFLLSGKHFKTAYYTDYKSFNDKILLSKMTIFNELQKWKKTTIEYLSIEKKSLPARYFNKNNLVHIKGL